VTEQTNEQPDLFEELRKEIFNRTKKPLKHPSFIIFFILAVLGFSATGIWLELYEYVYISSKEPADSINRLGSLRTAVITFFPAVAGTAAMQLIWSEQAKHFRSVAFLTLVIFFVVAIWIFPDSRITIGSALIVGSIASLFSVYVWWIANANQADLLDAITPSAPVGGDNLKGPLSGSLNDFQH
jgi:hypothetical protein